MVHTNRLQRRSGSNATFDNNLSAHICSYICIFVCIKGGINYRLVPWRIFPESDRRFLVRFNGVDFQVTPNRKVELGPKASLPGIDR